MHNHIVNCNLCWLHIADCNVELRRQVELCFLLPAGGSAQLSFAHLTILQSKSGNNDDCVHWNSPIITLFNSHGFNLRGHLEEAHVKYPLSVYLLFRSVIHLDASPSKKWFESKRGSHVIETGTEFSFWSTHIRTNIRCPCICCSRGACYLSVMPSGGDITQ